MLTEEQVSYFRSFGFLMQRNLLSPEEMTDIGRDFDEVMAEERGGETFSGDETQTVLWFVEHRPSLFRLAEDDRIYNAIGQLLGPDFLWVLSDANLYVGDTPWHGGDGIPAALEHVKVVIYLDPLTRDTESLRVIPGSHLPEYQQHLNLLEEQYGDPSKRPFGLAGAEVPAYSLDPRPGDVAFISEGGVWHGAFGGSPGRRQFTLIYYENPKTSEQVQYLRDFQQTTIAMFHPHENFLNSERPRIRGMVQRYVELGLA